MNACQRHLPPQPDTRNRVHLRTCVSYSGAVTTMRRSSTLAPISDMRGMTRSSRSWPRRSCPFNDPFSPVKSRDGEVRIGS